MNRIRHNLDRRIGASAPRRGFTLVELMTVIVILMILIAIGVPSIQAARKIFLTNVCYARLSVIKGACEAYRADWDEFPPSSYGATTQGRQLLVQSLTGFLDQAGDGQDGWGARKFIEGSTTKLGSKVYGPYNGAQDLPVTISGTNRVFLDAFNNEFYYYRFVGSTGSYETTHNTGGPTNLLTLLKKADGTYWQKDYVIMSKGPDGTWDSGYINNAKKNDITNFVSE